MNARSIYAASGLAASLCFCALSFAQGAASFPTKSITIIVPATAGGAIDITARLIGQKLTAR